MSNHAANCQQRAVGGAQRRYDEVEQRANHLPVAGTAPRAGEPTAPASSRARGANAPTSVVCIDLLEPIEELVTILVNYRDFRRILANKAGFLLKWAQAAE